MSNLSTSMSPASSSFTPIVSPMKLELTSPCKADEHLRAVLGGETSKTHTRAGNSATSNKSKDAGRTKRKYRSRARARSPTTILKAKKVRRAKANDRERGRMHNLNNALETLRTKLPCAEEEGKMTKIETLTLAHQYIRVLTESLTLSDEDRALFDPSARLQAIWRDFQASAAEQEHQFQLMQTPSIDTSFTSSGYSPSPPISAEYPGYSMNNIQPDMAMGYGNMHYQSSMNHESMRQYMVGEENYHPLPQQSQWVQPQLPQMQESFYNCPVQNQNRAYISCDQTFHMSSLS